MLICDIVKNSVWFDPRVRKQLYSYTKNGIDVVGVGMYDNRYKKEEVEKMPCEIRLVKKKDSYSKIPLLNKILREADTNKLMYKEILGIKPDIIHANDLNALVPAYKASKKLKCKIIYDTHEIFLENPWIASNKIMKFVWGWFEKHIIGKVDLVVCVSRAAGDYLQKIYNIPKPLVVTNCISENKYELAKEKNSPKEILNHGQYYVGRGYDILVDTAPLLKKYPDLKIVLRGFGSLEDMLRKKAEENKADNLEFAPPVHTDELVPYASRAWVGVAITEDISLNFKLSVSNKLFEYAAAGLPVIMSDIPEHRYLNDLYNFGVILKDNTPKSVCEAVEKLYSDDELYNSCVENAKKLSHEINWENEFAKLVKAENDMLKKGGEKINGKESNKATA